MNKTTRRTTNGLRLFAAGLIMSVYLISDCPSLQQYLVSSNDSEVKEATAFSMEDDDATPLPPSPPPPECTNSQLESIADTISSRAKLGSLTRCPDNTWIMQDEPPPASTADDGDTTHEASMSSSGRQPILWEIPPANRTFPPTAISVGCNKGQDAVNTLRMLSKNPMFDTHAWINALNASSLTKFQCGGSLTHNTFSQYHLPMMDTMLGATPSVSRRDDAQVYCIEPMPSTFAHLERALKQLKWPVSNFYLANLAMDGSARASASRPYILFPNTSLAGTESLGIKDCLGAESEGAETKKNGTCVKVALTTLDKFVLEHGIEEIDYLSVDTEGNDWPVLLGGMDVTLPRVKYLEFEYHQVGQWQHFSLKQAINTLAEHKGGFICYWAGAKGKLWRISGCWRDEYDQWKTWSNVACVSRRTAPTLAARMEERFLQTIDAEGA